MAYISKINEVLEESRKVQIYRKSFPLFWETAVEKLEWHRDCAKEDYYDEATPLELEPVIKEFSLRHSRRRDSVQKEKELHAKQEAFRSKLTNELEKITTESETFSQPSHASSEMIEKFKVCELACRVSSLHAEAGELGLSGEDTAPIQEMKSRIQNLNANYLKSHLIVGDEALWSGADCLSVVRWNSLAYWYNRIAKAREVYEWHTNHAIPLDNILEPVAAPVQGLHLVLLQCKPEERDDCRREFFKEVRALDYIATLKTKSLAELKPSADSLEYLLERALNTYCKKLCINNLKTLFSQNLHLGESEDTSAADRALLFPLLDECKNIGIKDSNPDIVNCLLKNGRILLEGVDKYRELLKWVIKKRVSKGKETVSTEESETTEIDKLNPICDSDDLWQRRAERWTRLDFCEEVQKQLKACETDIPKIVECLSILDDYCTNYTGGGFRCEDVGAPVSPESAATLQKFGKRRQFKCTDGTLRTFTWHIKPTQKLRIHFEFDPETRRMWVGYVGKHLPTVSNPS